MAPGAWFLFSCMINLNITLQKWLRVWTRSSSGASRSIHPSGGGAVRLVLGRCGGVRVVSGGVWWFWGRGWYRVGVGWGGGGFVLDGVVWGWCGGISYNLPCARVVWAWRKMWQNTNLIKQSNAGKELAQSWFTGTWTKHLIYDFYNPGSWAHGHMELTYKL